MPGISERLEQDDAQPSDPPVGSRADRTRWASARASLEFSLAFAFLNASMNVRSPATEPALWYLIPSLDVVLLFVCFALCGAYQKRISRFTLGVLVAAFVCCRILRIADGVDRNAFHRNFNTLVDVPLLPDLARLFYRTVPLPLFALACLGAVLALSTFGFLVRRALRVAERSLASPPAVRAFGCLVGALALLSPFEWHDPHENRSPFRLEDDRLFSGAFGTSILPRLAVELNFAANIYGYKADLRANIARTQHALGSHPLNLKKLGGRNVYLFIIESYGQCVMDRASLAARVGPEYDNFDKQLGAQGFYIASRVLDSTTYGGRSWLAHATLSTGVRTTDQLGIELLRLTQPKTLAQVFGQAGYRTVVVQPATDYETPLKDFEHFEARYLRRDFDYVGPKYGWSPMPDQYAIQYVHEREFTRPERPLLVEYALTSSHAPWSNLPPLIADWSRLRDGMVFNQTSGVHYPNGWLELNHASEAYADSIVYDFAVLRRYLSDFVKDESLIIVLGDHQPHSLITNQSPATGVPVHVLTRSAALARVFRERGYTPGMRPDRAAPHAGLETLMPELLSDLSEP